MPTVSSVNFVHTSSSSSSTSSASPHCSSIDDDSDHE